MKAKLVNEDLKDFRKNDNDLYFNINAGDMFFYKGRLIRIVDAHIDVAGHLSITYIGKDKYNKIKESFLTIGKTYFKDYFEIVRDLNKIF